MKPIHMRDAQFQTQALHFHWAGYKAGYLTNDPKQVTCKTCLRMLKRAERMLQDK